MKKLLLALSLCLCLNSFAVQAQETEDENHNGMVHYAIPKTFSPPKMKVLEASEDDLYDGAAIQPLTGQLSENEKLQENSTDLNYTEDNPQRPELLCSDEKLLQEVRDFIYQHVQSKKTNSVLEKRAQTLLVKNLHAFEEIDEKNIENNFEANAALMYLKVNEHREIYRICASRNNQYDAFKNTYLIIYPYINYYKVVVTNLIALPENMADATFLHSW